MPHINTFNICNEKLLVLCMKKENLRLSLVFLLLNLICTSLTCGPPTSFQLPIFAIPESPIPRRLWEKVGSHQPGFSVPAGKSPGLPTLWALPTMSKIALPGLLLLPLSTQQLTCLGFVWLLLELLTSLGMKALLQVHVLSFQDYIFTLT